MTLFLFYSAFVLLYVYLIRFSLCTGFSSFHFAIISLFLFTLIFLYHLWIFFLFDHFLVFFLFPFFHITFILVFFVILFFFISLPLLFLLLFIYFSSYSFPSRLNSYIFYLFLSRFLMNFLVCITFLLVFICYSHTALGIIFVHFLCVTSVTLLLLFFRYPFDLICIVFLSVFCRLFPGFL